MTLTHRPIAVPDAPAIPGLRFRGYAGEDDLPGIARVVNAEREADGRQDPTSAERLALSYRYPTNFDPDLDIVLAEVEGVIVGYGFTDWADETDGSRGYRVAGYVDPAWRRRGIGGALLAANEHRALEVAQAHETDRPRHFTAWTWDTNEGAASLAMHTGYTAVRRFFEMVRADLREVALHPLPGGIDVRPATTEDARRVYGADIEAFRDHWGDNEGSEADFRQWTEDERFDPSLWVVAWDGDEVAGHVICEIDRIANERYGRRNGHIDSVAVRRPWRRQGLARALLSRALLLLRERGMSRASLEVDAENPNQALALYRDVGFDVQMSATAYRKPLEWRHGDASL